MTVAAAYLRFSSDNQVGGESIEYQLEEVRKYADANGLTLDESHIYVDEAKTGKTRNAIRSNAVWQMPKTSPGHSTRC